LIKIVIYGRLETATFLVGPHTLTQRYFRTNRWRCWHLYPVVARIC